MSAHACAGPTIRRRPALDADAVRPLEPWALRLAPKAVADASEAHRAELARHDQLRAELQAAEAAVPAAGEADQCAAREAVERGKPVPPATYGAAVEAHETASRALEAGSRLARETQFTYLVALNDHRDEYTNATGTAHAALFEECLPLLERLEAALVELRGIRRLAEQLDKLAPALSRLPMFDASTTMRRGRDPLHGQPRDLLDGLRCLLETERPTPARAPR